MNYASCVDVQNPHTHLPCVSPDVLFTYVDSAFLLLRDHLLKIASFCKLHDYVQALLLSHVGRGTPNRGFVWRLCFIIVNGDPELRIAHGHAQSLFRVLQLSIIEVGAYKAATVLNYVWVFKFSENFNFSHFLLAFSAFQLDRLDRINILIYQTLTLAHCSERALANNFDNFEVVNRAVWVFRGGLLHLTRAAQAKR